MQEIEMGGTRGTNLREDKYVKSLGKRKATGET
jgi:hypothetical protein